MRRRLILVPLVLAASVLPGISPSFSTVSVGNEPAVCFGQVATIIGETGEELVGTDGPDVVITNGAFSGKTLGGDDLVCVTGAPAEGGDADFKTGSGSDRVDASASMTGVRVALGPGPDEFIGGPMRDGVDATAPDLAPDRVATAGDVDFVTSDGGDTIDLGPGADFLSLRGEASGGVFIGGRGRNTFGLGLMRRDAHAWKLNNGTKRLTRDGALAAMLHDFSRFTVVLRGMFTFVGSQDREALLVGAGKHWASGRPVHALMRGGNDTVMIEGAENTWRSAAGGEFDGGHGVDMFRYQRYETERPVPTSILFDMQSGILRDTWPAVWPGIWDGGKMTRRAVNFENADVRNPYRTKANVYGSGPVTIKGTNGPNRLRVQASGPETDQVATMFGRAGDDVLEGTYSADVLIGGQGTDIARGHRGIDHCEAEFEHHCDP